MNLRDFITSSEDNANLVWQYAVKQGIKFDSMESPWKPVKQGAQTTLAGKLALGTDEEIEALASTLNIEFDADETVSTPVKRVVKSVPADLYADEQRDTVTTKKGEEIEVLMLPYVERTSRKGKGNVKLALKNGNFVIVPPHDTLISLGLAKGDLVPVSPDSLVFTKQEGYFYGNVNFSHSTFHQIVQDIQQLDDEMESWEIKCRKVYKMSQKQIDKARTQKALESNPIPTIKSVYFK